MKKLLLTFLGMSCMASVMAQDNYSLTTRTENYTEITNGTVVQNGDWDDFQESMVMPFAFKFFGVDIDSLFILDDGVFFTQDGDDYLSPNGLDPESRGTDMSPVSYRVDGTGNNRILKIQWPNVSFFEIKDNYPNDFANYQVWLYEGSNVIEFHYGSSFFSQDAFEMMDMYPFLVAIAPDKGIIVGGDPTNPDISRDLNNEITLDAHPSVNSIFVFTPDWATGVAALEKNGIKVYPVPVNDALNIDSETELVSVRVYNAAGQLVNETKAQENHVRLSSKTWDSGVYIVEIETLAGVEVRKVVK